MMACGLRALRGWGVWACALGVLAPLLAMARQGALGSTFDPSREAALVAGTTLQRGAKRVTATDGTLTFRLGNRAFLTARTAGGLETNFVPTRMRVATVTVYDPNEGGALAEGNLGNVSATLAVGGEVFASTAVARRRESVSFLTAEGLTLTATPVDFSFASAALPSDAVATLKIAVKGGGAPVLAGFSNALTTSGEGAAREDFHFSGNGDATDAPYVTLAGTATVRRFELFMPEGATKVALSALLPEGVSREAFEEACGGQDAIVVAQLRPGGTLTLDVPIAKAAFVAASLKETQPLTGGVLGEAPPMLAFQKGVAMAGPVSLRGSRFRREGGDFEGAPLKASLGLTGDTSAWAPADVMVRCDLRVDCPIPDAGWFAGNPLTIASGRRVVLTHAWATEGELPDIAFEAADSTFVFARREGGADIPGKYRALLRGASGTVAFARTATLGADPDHPGELTVGAGGFAHTLEQLTEGTTLTVKGATLVLGADAEASGALRQHAGTLALGDVVLARNEAASGRYLQDAGVAAMDGVRFPATGREALFRVGDGEGGPATTTLSTLTTEGAGSGSVTLEVLPDGRLEVSDGIAVADTGRHTLTLKGGVLAKTGGKAEVRADFGAKDALRVEGGGTLESETGTLTLSAVTGGGALGVAGKVNIEALRDYNGRVGLKEGASGGSRVTFGALAGASGRVELGSLGGPDPLGMVAKAAQNYHGTLAFGQGFGDALDFSGLREILSFPYTLDFTSLGASKERPVTITLRLDQYADAAVRWPADATGITLRLIESGAYGGEATIPAFPKGGAFELVRYAGGGDALEPVPDVERTPNENGVADELTWDSPQFTGQGAWIDVECDGNTQNTGWFELKGMNGESGKNGILFGHDGADQGVMDVTKQRHAPYFVTARHPEVVDGAVGLAAMPYVSKPSLHYPEAWSVAVRLTMPKAGSRCLMMIGANYLVGSDSAALKAQYPSALRNALIVSTGESGNHLQLWYAPDAERHAPEEAKLLTEVRLANADVAAYVVSVTCDGKRMVIYLDGAQIMTWEPEGGIPPLGPGLQVGSCLGGEFYDANTAIGRTWGKTFARVKEGEGGSLDYFRFYKGVLTAKAMEEMAKRTPHVLENVRFVRDVPHAGNDANAVETWIDEANTPWFREVYANGAWTREQEDGKDKGYAQPEEGAALLLRVAPGEHLVQVNVARDPDNLFYSPNRTYATLLAEPQAGAAEAGVVRIVPLGVEKPDYEASGWIAGNAWYGTGATTEADKVAGVAYHYGRLRFTGGAEDPICDDPTIADFYGAGYLLPSAGYPKTSAYGDEWGAFTPLSAWKNAGNGAWERTVTRTRCLTTKPRTTSAPGVKAICDAGICWFSELAPIGLKDAAESLLDVTYAYTERRTGGKPADNAPVEAGNVLGADAPGAYVIAKDVKSSAVGNQPGELTLHAGLSLTRGVDDEAKTWQLTGPIAVEGNRAHDPVAGNPGATNEQQASEDVWVLPYNDAAHWTFFDRTRSPAHGGNPGNLNGVKPGLFAQGVQTPGRLYLDLTHGDSYAMYGDDRAFSKQKWYRYGYPGATATLSGLAPREASRDDYGKAIAFQVRLRTGEDATLDIDKAPAATVDTFYLDRPADPQGGEPAAAAGKVATLFLDARPGRLPIRRTVVVGARLDVATEGDDALTLAPGVEIHKGPSDNGAYVVGRQDFPWSLNGSSVPSLEAAPGGELTFSVAQDFSRHGTDLVAHRGATIAQRAPAAMPGGAALHARSLTLAEGSALVFGGEAAGESSDAIHITGAVRLAPEGEGDLSATLTGEAPWRVIIDGGLHGPTPASGHEATATLRVSAPAGVAWELRPAAPEGAHNLNFLSLAKVGEGTVDFPDTKAPAVDGAVRVEAGALKVGTAETPSGTDAHAGPAIGHRGLHVAAGATLAMTEDGNANGVLACIPDGQRLTGAGVIDGALRLNRGATYDCTDGTLGMTVGRVVADSQEGPNITVALSEGYVSGTTFLTSLREERLVRRRLLSTRGGARWNTCGAIHHNENPRETRYSATPPGLPPPNYANEPVEWRPADKEAYTDGADQALIADYQNRDIADVGLVKGYTKAKTHGLNAAEVSGVYRCFRNVWAFEASHAEQDVEQLDASQLFMGYEFGVSRLAILPMAGLPEADGIRRDDAGAPLYVVAEVKVESRLGKFFGLKETAKAAFAPDVRVVFVKPGEADKPLSVTELDGFGGKALASAPGAPPSARYFAIPYTTTDFPDDVSVFLDVRAERSAAAK